MLLRSVARAGPSSLLRASLARQSGKNLKTPLLACTALNNREIRHSSTSHAISNPTLAGIEKRWEKMSPQEQADLWMALRDRMKNDWHELTLQERKAGGSKVPYEWFGSRYWEDGRENRVPWPTVPRNSWVLKTEADFVCD